MAEFLAEAHRHSLQGGADPATRHDLTPEEIEAKLAVLGPVAARSHVARVQIAALERAKANMRSKD